ncbi:MAG: MgtC/SapB family protein [Anaerolineae bacterium]
MPLTWIEITLRLVLSMVLGGFIGWEREVEGKPAGLRTLMLVSLGAAIFVLAGINASLQAGEPIDALRAMSGVAEGVGFLGAGLIFRTRRTVHLLTTAAAVWAAAGVGVAVGLGQYYMAILASALVFVTLRFFDRLEQRMLQQGKSKDSGEKKGDGSDAG